jgi:hypothetical protein
MVTPQARQLVVLWSWVAYKDPPKHYEDLADSIVRHLKAATQAAEGEELHPTGRFWLFRKEPPLEHAMSSLDAAEAASQHRSPVYVLSEMPCMLNDLLQRHLLRPTLADRSYRPTRNYCHINLQGS